MIFEAIIHDQIYSNYWLGANTESIKTAEFDDVKNGIDEILEIKTKPHAASYLGLAIDVTHGDDLANKMERAKQEILKGKMATLKYFNGPDFKGTMKNVPRVVIGVDRKMLMELIDLWVNKKNKSLADHPVKYLIIEEVARQLGSFQKFAEKNGQIEIVNKIKTVFEAVNRIKLSISSEKEFKDIVYQHEDDKVFDAINRYLEIMSRIK